MRAISLFSILFVLGHAAAAPAQAERRLTIDDALDRARRANRGLVAARARVELDEAEVTAARAALLPSVSVRARSLINSARFELQTSPNEPAMVLQPTGQLDTLASLVVPVVAPGPWHQLRAARHYAAAAGGAYEVEQLDILEQVGKTFYVAAGADELVKVRENAVTLASRTAHAARARVEVGTANQAEITRADSALVAARQQHAEATRSRDATYRALATLLDLDPPFSVDAAPLASEQGRQVARPELVQMSQQVAAAAAAERASDATKLPMIAAFGTAKIGNDRNFAGDRHWWAVGLQLDWQLHDGGARRAQRERARAQKREAEAMLAQLRDSIDDEVRDTRDQVEYRRLGAEAASRQRELARETFALVRAQYEVGTSTQLELLSAQDALVIAEAGVALASMEASIAEIAVRRAEGRLR